MKHARTRTQKCALGRQRVVATWPLRKNGETQKTGIVNSLYTNGKGDQETGFVNRTTRGASIKMGKPTKQGQNEVRIL
jgi:hypothetical protein